MIKFTKFYNFGNCNVSYSFRIKNRVSVIEYVKVISNSMHKRLLNIARNLLKEYLVSNLAHVR